SIGNHTCHHLNGWKTSAEKYVENVFLAEEVISEEKKEIEGRIEKKEKRVENRENREKNREKRGESGETTEIRGGNSKLFRPPYGKISGKQAKLLQKENYKIIMWDVLSKDYQKSISPERCLQNVLQNAVSGSIIVFHDSKKAEKNLRAVLPLVLEYFSKKGFEFKRLL
ncbi:MAG TPA: polysaccharide deacetylase family protein, partial [Salinimicrobium sp.]|nr:polysaccharide deacetylase family protein [Salinimicrobium sp.]